VLANLKNVKGNLTHLFAYPSHQLHPQRVDCVLNLVTDAWTSPNSHAFVAMTIHYEEEGIPRTFLLDIVECVESHTGATLATTLVNTVDNFGISNKVWLI
jgi:hypothetical protein